MKKNHYVSGQWNFICDSCGQKLKSGESRQRWDGFQVCSECWEPRHPQDFVRARQDKITVPFVRPDSVVYIPLSNEDQSDTINNDTFNEITFN
jgi:hypothetical protein